MKNKLQYEWKNVFRILNKRDTSDSGDTNPKHFEQALRSTGVFLSTEDLRRVTEHYGDKTTGKINYSKMS